MNTHESILSPRTKLSYDQTYSIEGRTELENANCTENSFTKSRLQAYINELSNVTHTSHREPTGSVVESSELGKVRPQFRLGERLATVLMTSESVLSRNRLQECSVHLEKLCEHRNSLMNSKKFEEQVILDEIPGLYVPVFTVRPTIAFCNRCGRDVKTRVKKLEPKLFGMNFVDLFCCCAPKYLGSHEVIHLCSRCNNQLVKITI